METCGFFCGMINDTIHIFKSIFLNMKKLLFTFFFFFSIFSGTAQEVRLKIGTVTDSLPILGLPDANYSLYLPSDFSNEKRWPIIFVFDIEGRNNATTNLFRSAAEEQGYIVASPNMDLRSQPIDSIVKKATMFVQNVVSLVPVNSDLVYAAGLGNGAQLASSLPLIFNKINGIMAVGNSFVNPKYIDKTRPYMFVGLAGRKDYMIYEMEKYLKFYDKIDFPANIYYFDGKENEWPESPVISNATSSFTLNAIRNNLREADKDFINSMYQKELDYIQALRRQRHFYMAFVKLERMIEKFEDFGYKEELEEFAKSLKREKAFKSQRRDFKKAISYEKFQQDEYEFLLQSDVMAVNFQNIGWWALQIDELEKLKESTDEFKANVAYRLHGYLDFLSKREFKAVTQSKAPLDRKIFVSVLRTAIDKDDPEAYLKIIGLASADGDKETALLYLEDLLKTGFSDMEELYDIEGALDLQFTEEYNAIIKKYLGESKFYN